LRRRALTILIPLLLVAAAFARSGPTFDSQAEQQIFQLVNRERHSRGLSTLVFDERLQRAARKHSLLMADTGEVEHQLAGEPKLSLRLGEVALRYDVSGENVARTSGAARAHTALMNSPGHRANILDAQFNAIGIGVVDTPDGIYVTQDFARRLPTASVDDAEMRVALNLDRLRKAIGLTPWPRIPAPELRNRACKMAERDNLNPKAGLLSTKISNSVAFTAIDLTQVPESLERLKISPSSAFSVGACYRASATYDNPVFWVIVVTYF
jgi:hypothetical protein